MNALVSAAWEAVCDEPSDKLVLVNLADHANAKGCAWPKLKTLAGETGLAPRTVAYSLHRLELRGHIAVSRRQGCKHRYQVHPKILNAHASATIAAAQPLQQSPATIAVVHLQPLQQHPNRKGTVREP